MATQNKNLSLFNKPEIPSAKGMRFGIVVANWNGEITNNLLTGVKSTLLECGASEKNITIIEVPGSFELVFGAKLLSKKKLDAIICLGSVIKGETKHFDFVCNAVSLGIKDLNIAQIGHPILRNKTKDIPINDIKSNNTQKIIEKMIQTMRKHNGAGLAANQIYEPIRICIIEVLDNPRYKHLNTIPLKILINPKVIIKKDTATFNSYEGCLSVPNLRGKVRRYNSINVTYYTMDAKKITENIKGLESIVYQHEIDHLDGYLFTDKVEDNSTLVTYENYQKYYEEEYKKELEKFNNIAENLS